MLSLFLEPCVPFAGSQLPVTPPFSASLYFFLMLHAFSTRKMAAAHFRYMPALAHCVKCPKNAISAVLNVCILYELYQLCCCQLLKEICCRLMWFQCGWSNIVSGGSRRAFVFVTQRKHKSQGEDVLCTPHFT